MRRAFSGPGPAATLAILLLGFAPLLRSSGSLGPPTPSQAIRPRENLHGLVRRVQLNPPLRSGSFRVRFSPDGRYLLAQDSTGIFVFSADPLKLLVHLEADRPYHASFTPDSQAIRVVTRDLRVATRNIENLEQLDLKTLPLKDGCLSVAVSSNGARLACAQLDFSIRVFDLGSGEEIYTGSSNKELANQTRVMVPLDTDSVYASPIGFILVDSWAPYVNRGRPIIPMLFSPNGQELIVGNLRASGFRIDLQTHKKLSLPGAIKDHLHSSLTWLDGDRVVALEREKPHTPKIFSVENGAVLSTLPITADAFQPCSNGRFLLMHDLGTSGGRIFDLQENRALDIPENIGVDVFGSVMALMIEDGELYLYHVGDKLPYRLAHIPLGNLPELRAASVDSSLGVLALAVDGQSGLFSSSVGGRISNFPRFLAADVSKVPSVFLTMPGSAQQTPAKILRFDTASGTSSEVASAGNELLRAGGSVLFEYSFENPAGKGMMFNLTGGVSYQLRAIEPDSGKTLWKRSFLWESPVPFPDPQGTRLVLGWRAKSDQAREAAGHYPAAKQILKKAKLDDNDTFFEVLDALTGKSIGGVLVQFGNHASSFDAAFSEGDTLFLLKDGIRVSLFSLSDGGLKAKLVGDKPAVNAVSNLLALNESAGKLTLYDTNNGTKLDQFLFPDEIAYSRFSEDGRRLFVLTQHQVAFVLDVSAARQSAPNAVN